MQGNFHQFVFKKIEKILKYLKKFFPRKRQHFPSLSITVSRIKYIYKNVTLLFLCDILFICWEIVKMIDRVENNSIEKVFNFLNSWQEFCHRWVILNFHEILVIFQSFLWLHPIPQSSILVDIFGNLCAKNSNGWKGFGYFGNTWLWLLL